jgi:hypothetical protein
VLFQAFLWGFAGHTYIEAFQHAVELRIGQAESGVFGKNTF